MLLSVVVTIVDGGPALERCLHALATQQNAPRLEVVVPWDATLGQPGTVAARYPDYRFLELGVVPTERDPTGPAGQHELFDRRRAAGLAAAHGDLVAILEDRGVPDPDWAQTAVRLHAELDHAVIGGAIDNARDGTLNWAVYFCDFGRYQPPFAAGPREYVSDVNICYKRRALEQTRELWAARYHETTVHWSLRRAGETLYLSPALVVRQVREGLRLSALLRERVGWGRLFAYTRARDLGALRFALAAASPALPLLLFVRHLRGRLARRRTVGRFIAAAPAVLLLLAAWSAGEMAGYLTGRP